MSNLPDLWYNRCMENLGKKHAKQAQLLREAINLHKIEGNPLTCDEVEMFAMFEREGWSDERCREYMIEQLGVNKKTKLAA